LTRESSAVNELCKDVSAFANSAGGQIVFGVEEDKKKTRKPSKVDDGVADPKITREWIEQVPNSKIQPRIAGIRISPVQVAKGFGYVISVPQSHTGPHQAPDLKYYKRFELQSVAMYYTKLKTSCGERPYRTCSHACIFLVVTAHRSSSCLTRNFPRHFSYAAALRTGQRNRRSTSSMMC
jgi:predicted HTH transcriptional regulator